MRKLTIVLFTIFTINAKAQLANAGRDVTIYLTSTSTATLDGSASTGTSFLWREISTDFMSGAIISSPKSKTTTVTGFLPGTFYFEMAATKGATTTTDSVVVRVDVDAPPAYATLHRFLNLSDPAILHTINWRGDTTNYFLTNNAVHSQMQGADGQRWNLYRDRTNGLMIDRLRGKIRSQIRDGYRAPTDDFARAEIQIDAPSTIIDTNKILMFEWKGYYPSQPLYMHNRNDGIGTIFQIHSNSSNQSSGLGFGLNGDSSITFILYSNDSTFSREATVLVGKYKDWVNRSHTIRITIREGYGYKNHPAFVKLDIDGVQKLIIDTGKIGGTPGTIFLTTVNLVHYMIMVKG